MKYNNPKVKNQELWSIFITTYIFLSIAFDIFRPVTDIYFWIEKKAIGTVLFIPPKSIWALIKSIAYSWHRINSVFAIFWFVRTLNLRNFFALFFYVESFSVLKSLQVESTWKLNCKKNKKKLPQRDAHTDLFFQKIGEVRDILDFRIDDLNFRIYLWVLKVFYWKIDFLIIIFLSVIKLTIVAHVKFVALFGISKNAIPFGTFVSGFVVPKTFFETFYFRLSAFGKTGSIHGIPVFRELAQLGQELAWQSIQHSEASRNSLRPRWSQVLEGSPKNFNV